MAAQNSPCLQVKGDTALDPVSQAPEALAARHWRLFAAALVGALTIPRLWQRGMFLDGMTYAVLARNMADGQGSFWAPSLSATLYSKFFEQPPLGIGLEAIAFTLLGDHPAVERLFSLVVLALHLVIVASIWRRLLPAAYDWLPLLFFVLPATATWAVVNNMLENTQALLTSAAVLALLRTSGDAGAARTAGWSALAGAAIVAGVLVKTPVALFPLAFPLIMRFLPAERRPARPWVAIAVLYATTATLAVALLLHEPARANLWAVTSSHLIPQLTGERGGDSLWAGVARLASGVWLRMAVLAALVWVLWGRRGVPTHSRTAWFFLTFGCAASLPIIAASRVLPGHYFLPSIPFFALGFAALLLPAIAHQRARPGTWAWRAPLLAAVALAVASVMTLVLHGAIEQRDRAMIRSLDRLDATIPEGATIGTCAGDIDWGLVNYLQRFYRVSLDPSAAPSSGWFLMRRQACVVPSSCHPAADSETLLLFRCTEPDARR